VFDDIQDLVNQTFMEIDGSGRAHYRDVILPALNAMVVAGGDACHPAMLTAAVNSASDGLRVPPGTMFRLRLTALDWIETQQASNPRVIEAVASRIVANAIQSNALAALPRGSSASRKIVRGYVDSLRDERRKWDKLLKNNSKQQAILSDELPTPPPSAAALLRVEELFRIALAPSHTARSTAEDVAGQGAPQPAKFCSACGTKLADGGRFCQECGASIQ